MRQFLRKYFKEVVFTGIIIICLILIGCGAILVSSYFEDLQEQACVKATLYIDNAKQSLNDTIQDYLTDVKIATEKIVNQQYENEFDFTDKTDIMLNNDERFKNLIYSYRYFRGSEEFYGYGSGETYTLVEDPAILARIGKTEAACVGMVYDAARDDKKIAFCVPVSNFEYADMIVYFYQLPTIFSFKEDVNKDYLNESKMTLMVDQNGQVLNVLYTNEDETIVQYQDALEYIFNDILDSEIVTRIRENLLRGENGAYAAIIEGNTNIIAVSSVPLSNGVSFGILGLYKAETIYYSGYTTVNTILGALISISFILLLFCIYYFVSRKRTNDKILTMNDIDMKYGFDSLAKFTREANQTIIRNHATKFAIVITEVKHFEYLQENFGTKTTDGILKYMNYLLSKFLQIDEAMGYVSDSCFALLLHYRDKERLMERLNTVHILASQFREGLPSNYSIDIVGGIYLLENNSTNDINRMIDFAKNAKDNQIDLKNSGVNFQVYDDTILKKRSQNEYIEVHMKSAMEKGDFKVFFQPKQNLKTMLPDGCEALVRWWNSEIDAYMKPGEFIPLFEANGFIVELDHYIYRTVCDYIRKAVTVRETVYPVSVNVSRLTVIQDDFVPYYTNIKEEYNIPDGFLTLEFTESVAFENYDRLKEVVRLLHKRGFKCSIDDFGSGYSSYNILKELPMDEIKLDQFFIQKGDNAERDYKILESVINIGNALKMKVTQEGVETQDQRELLTKLGCHVIQGYHYAKPLEENDYMTFIYNATKEGQIGQDKPIRKVNVENDEM